MGKKQISIFGVFLVLNMVIFMFNVPFGNSLLKDWDNPVVAGVGYRTYSFNATLAQFVYQDDIDGYKTSSVTGHYPSRSDVTDIYYGLIFTHNQTIPVNATLNSCYVTFYGHAGTLLSYDALDNELYTCRNTMYFINHANPSWFSVDYTPKVRDYLALPDVADFWLINYSNDTVPTFSFNYATYKNPSYNNTLAFVLMSPMNTRQGMDNLENLVHDINATPELLPRCTITYSVPYYFAGEPYHGSSDVGVLLYFDLPKGIQIFSVYNYTLFNSTFVSNSLYVSTYSFESRVFYSNSTERFYLFLTDGTDGYYVTRAKHGTSWSSPTVITGWNGLYSQCDVSIGYDGTTCYLARRNTIDTSKVDVKRGTLSGSTISFDESWVNAIDLPSTNVALKVVVWCDASNYMYVYCGNTSTYEESLNMSTSSTSISLHYAANAPYVMGEDAYVAHSQAIFNSYDGYNWLQFVDYNGSTLDSDVYKINYSNRSVQVISKHENVLQNMKYHNGIEIFGFTDVEDKLVLTSLYDDTPDFLKTQYLNTDLTHGVFSDVTGLTQIHEHNGELAHVICGNSDSIIMYQAPNSDALSASERKLLYRTQRFANATWVLDDQNWSDVHIPDYNILTYSFTGNAEPFKGYDYSMYVYTYTNGGVYYTPFNSVSLLDGTNSAPTDPRYEYYVNGELVYDDPREHPYDDEVDDMLSEENILTLLGLMGIITCSGSVFLFIKNFSDNPLLAVSILIFGLTAGWSLIVAMLGG